VPHDRRRAIVSGAVFIRESFLPPLMGENETSWLLNAGKVALSRSLWAKGELFRLPVSLGSRVRRCGRAKFSSVNQVAKVEVSRQLTKITLA
jgi:hypothetical protein